MTITKEWVQENIDENGVLKFPDIFPDHENEPLVDFEPNCFQGNLDLKQVILSDCCTYIDNNAFKNCRNLESVIINGGEISGGVNVIGSRAFSGCESLKEVIINSPCLNTIENAAFSGCSALTSIELPESVQSIGTSAFAYCRNLSDVSILAENVDFGKEPFASTAENIQFQFASPDVEKELCAKSNSEDRLYSPLYAQVTLRRMETAYSQEGDLKAADVCARLSDKIEEIEENYRSAGKINDLDQNKALKEACKELFAETDRDGQDFINRIRMNAMFEIDSSIIAAKETGENNHFKTNYGNGFAHIQYERIADCYKNGNPDGPIKVANFYDGQVNVYIERNPDHTMEFFCTNKNGDQIGDRFLAQNHNLDVTIAIVRDQALEYFESGQNLKNFEPNLDWHIADKVDKEPVSVAKTAEQLGAERVSAFWQVLSKVSLESATPPQGISVKEWMPPVQQYIEHVGKAFKAIPEDTHPRNVASYVLTEGFKAYAEEVKQEYLQSNGEMNLSDVETKLEIARKVFSECYRDTNIKGLLPKDIDTISTTIDQTVDSVKPKLEVVKDDNGRIVLKNTDQAREKSQAIISKIHDVSMNPPQNFNEETWAVYQTRFSDKIGKDAWGILPEAVNPEEVASRVLVEGFKSYANQTAKICNNIPYSDKEPRHREAETMLEAARTAAYECYKDPNINLSRDDLKKVDSIISSTLARMDKDIPRLDRNDFSSERDFQASTTGAIQNLEDVISYQDWLPPEQTDYRLLKVCNEMKNAMEDYLAENPDCVKSDYKEAWDAAIFIISESEPDFTTTYKAELEQIEGDQVGFIKNAIEMEQSQAPAPAISIEEQIARVNEMTIKSGISQEAMNNIRKAVEDRNTPSMEM